MRLYDLLQDIKLEDTYQLANVEITNLSAKVEEANKDSMFFCFSGSISSKEKMQKAFESNIKVLVVEEIDKSYNCTQIKVGNVRRVMSLISKKFYGVTDDLKVIGITGTNGKTTSTYLLKHILETSGKKVGVIGTEGCIFGNKIIAKGLTTPDPIDLFRILKQMQDDNVQYVFMEVSAHAIALNKIDGINFYRKIITNITQDHLDFFKTFATYKKTKINFIKQNNIVSFVNADDIELKELYDLPNVKTFGLNNPSDCFAVSIANGGSEFYINIMDKVVKIKTPIKGIFNVYNIMGASLCACSLGIKIDDIKEALSSFNGVKGRLNIFKDDNNRTIVIDFAHTPDGIENILKTCRDFTDRKLYCIFGCGGDRDKTKRPIMAKICEQYSDYTIITSDNPRSEDPNVIIKEICAGFKGYNHIEIENRSTAIEYASQILKEGDTLVICGKGAENYQEIKGVKYAYNDYDEVYKNFNLDTKNLDYCNSNDV